MPIAEVLRDGDVVLGEGSTVIIARDGTTRPVESTAAPLKDDQGTIGGVVLVFRDITDRRRAEAQLAEQTRLTESLHRVGSRLAAELDLRTIVRLVIEETVAITRAAFGAFYYDDDEDQAGLDPTKRAPRGPLTLYATAGRLPAVYPPKRAASAVSAAFRGERVVRIADSAQGPPTDPNNPPSWPSSNANKATPETRSLLAVPVVSRSGRVLGVMILGHPDPSVFAANDERLSMGIAAQAAVAIDNARLYRDAQESEQRFRQLAENVSDIFWMYELPSRRLLYVGPAFETIWGLSCQSFYEAPQSAFELIHPEDRTRALSAFERHQRGEPSAEEYRITRPDGAIRWLWDRGFPIKDEFGKVVRVAGIVEDITERKAAEEFLRESDRRKTEFLALLAHELRNPLTPFRNALHYIKARSSETNQDRFPNEHEMIDRQVVHMTRLIDDLVDVARISQGKIALRPEPVDLGGIVQSAVDSIRNQVQKSGHSISVSLPDTPIILMADPTRLEQIVGNLLNNAVKYTNPGGTINLTVARDDTFALIRIKDTGIGISDELLPRIFDWFVQGLHPRDRAQGGIGIGLSLVHTLVQMHGGSILARSEGPGKGSEFLVRLPIAVSMQIGRQLPANPPSSFRSEERPGRHRVLVVDDNHDAATSLVRLLTSVWGQEVRVAHDGPSALEVASEFQPELVLLDIGLPGMSGYEVAKNLRRRPEFEATRLIAITGWGQDEDRRKSSEAGFDRHMVKPIEPEALAHIVAGLDVGVAR
jgi:PAS domain S-box-containing protein